MPLTTRNYRNGVVGLNTYAGNDDAQVELTVSVPDQYWFEVSLTIQGAGQQCRHEFTMRLELQTRMSPRSLRIGRRKVNIEKSCHIIAEDTSGFGLLVDTLGIMNKVYLNRHRINAYGYSVAPPVESVGAVDISTVNLTIMKKWLRICSGGNIYISDTVSASGNDLLGIRY